MTTPNVSKPDSGSDKVENPARTSMHSKFEITSSSLPSSLAVIKPLDGNNYVEWAERIEDMLKCQGLWIILRDDDFEKDPLKKQWLQDKTFGMMKLAINRKAVAVPSSIKKPKELWDYLQAKYTPKDTMRCITLIRRFHSLVMEENESLPAFIHRVETLAADLEEVGEPITDRMIAWTLLAGLPHKFDSLVMGYAASHNKNDITSDSVKHALYFEDSRTVTEPVALNKQFPNSSLYSSKSSGLTCWNCGGMGHKKSSCNSSTMASQGTS